MYKLRIPTFTPPTRGLLSMLWLDTFFCHPWHHTILKHKLRVGKNKSSNFLIPSPYLGIPKINIVQGTQKWFCNFGKPNDSWIKNQKSQNIFGSITQEPLDLTKLMQFWSQECAQVTTSIKGKLDSHGQIPEAYGKDRKKNPAAYALSKHYFIKIILRVLVVMLTSLL